jgi:hypothetical protein
MEWVATSEGLLAPGCVEWHAAENPTCLPIVVDMPAGSIRGSFVSAPDARILLPMREGPVEIGAAARDFRDVQAEHERQGNHRGRADQGLPPAWLLPIGWPRGLRPEDYAAILGRRRALQEMTGSFPVIRSGVPSFDMLDLDFIDDGDRFALTDEQWDAAKNLALAILTATDSSWATHAALALDTSGV